MEKFNLFPEGCLVMEHMREGGGLLALASVAPQAHPGPQSTPAPAFPPAPDCLFIHDLAVLPRARGYGATYGLIEIIEKLARKRAIPYLALVSVYGTYPLWGRFGFEVVTDDALAEKLKTYGDQARYMVWRLG